MSNITLYNALYKYSIQYNYIIIIKKIILFLYCIFLQYKNSIILNNLSKFLTNYRSKIKYLNFLNIEICELGTFQIKIRSKPINFSGAGKKLLWIENMKKLQAYKTFDFHCMKYYKNSNMKILPYIYSIKFKLTNFTV